MAVVSAGWAARTLRIVLENLEVHVCVCNDDVQLFVKWKELGCDTFELVLASAKKHHFVRFFL